LSFGLSDLQLLVHHFQPLQIAEDILWHPLRKIDETVIFKDLNATDHAALKSCLTGDGAHKIARFDPVPVANFNPVTLHRLLRRPARPLSATITVLAVTITITLATAVVLNPLVIPLLAQQRFRTDRQIEGRVGQLLRGDVALGSDALDQLLEQSGFLF